MQSRDLTPRTITVKELNIRIELEPCYDPKSVITVLDQAGDRIVQFDTISDHILYPDGEKTLRVALVREIHGELLKQSLRLTYLKDKCLDLLNDWSLEDQRKRYEEQRKAREANG